MTDTSVEPDWTTAQPSRIPERMEFEVPWTTTAPDGVDVEIHVWADRGRGDVLVHILNGPTLGTIADVRLNEPTLTPAPEAVTQYGQGWVRQQLADAQQIMSHRVPRR